MSSNSTTTVFQDPGYASDGFIMSMATIVFIMTPGVGFFYSGLMKGKQSLQLIYVSMLCMAIVTIQWFLFGFSLDGSPIIGNFKHFALMNSQGLGTLQVAPAIPALTLFIYQLQFAAITPSIIFGSVADRLKLLPALLFIFLWTTFVYDFVAYWTWGNRGWLRNLACLGTTQLSQTPCALGAIDFAGGGPVHICSGFAGLAYSIFLGKKAKRPQSNPANLQMVFLGTALIWFGWFGFNGGSAVAATPRATNAMTVTTISASFAGFSWNMFDFFYTRKISGVGFCCGAVAGLVIITPASGFVAPWAAAIFGIVAGVLANYFSRLKEVLGFDDTLDAFGIHGVCGIAGNILAGIFHQKWVTLLDGTVTNGGAIEGNVIELGYQLIGASVIAVYAFAMTFAILLIVNAIPGFTLRGDYEDDEDTDLQEVGESIIPKTAFGLTPENA